MSRNMCPHARDLNEGICGECDPMTALVIAEARVELLEEQVAQYASLVHSDYCGTTCCSRCDEAHALLGVDPPQRKP